MIPAVRRSCRIRTGINHAGNSRHTELKQTKFLPIGMETVCLDVDPHTICFLNPLEQLRQLGIGRNKTRWQCRMPNAETRRSDPLSRSSGVASEIRITKS